MFILNNHPDYGAALGDSDITSLGAVAAAEAERFLRVREGHRETPLVCLPSLARNLQVSSIHVKDEGHRLGLGSFKALGGSYAVIRLVLEEATRHFGRHVDITELASAQVRSVAKHLTITCATDGNHGRSVAQGAQLVGARCVIFVHSGVSEDRIRVIAHYGAEIVRVVGSYDDSVQEAKRVAGEQNWTVVSDTSWPGYERIPTIVMQGYTALLGEALRQMPLPPTHVFIQAGVGGIAGAVAGHLSLILGNARPFVAVVDPSRAACLFESAKAGKVVKIAPSEPTVMAMLECYEPSLVAWRILSRTADAFMTVDDEDAVAAMKLMADPLEGDPPIVAGESGGVGLAALLKVALDKSFRKAVGLNEGSRIFLINTEGATDPNVYEQIVGRPPQLVAASNSERVA